MKWEETFEQTKHAFQNDEMYDLLTGKENYHLPVYGAPVSVPTDWTSVLSEGIFKLYKDTKDERLIKDYESAVHKLITGKPLEVWMAANIVAYHLQCESGNKAAFEIDKKIIDELSDAVRQNRDELSSDKSYQGSGNEYGLLDDILRLNNIVLKDCNIEMIK